MSFVKKNDSSDLLKMKGIVYITTCKITNLQYIGSSTGKNDIIYDNFDDILEYRISYHKKDLPRMMLPKFYPHILEYGFNNLDWSILKRYDDITKFDLERKEGEFQRLFDTKENGLNCNYANPTHQQRRENDNQSRQVRRNERKMYCELCDKHFNYDAEQEHLDSKNHQHKLGNYEYKCIGNEKEYFAKRYQEKKKSLQQEIKCSCGKMVKKGNLTRHKKTKKHLSNLHTDLLTIHF